METSHTKVLIIGTGPAGYTAAIYSSRANLSPIVIEGFQPGGQLTTTTDVENFPGFPESISGVELMDRMKTQATRFGSTFVSGKVTQIDLSKRPFVANINNGEREVTADSVIIATGASAKYLDLPDESKYAGMGVSACATCDGFFYRGLKVAVVGGGDTACEEATYLSSLAQKVYMIVRRDELRASKVMADRVLNNPKIEILWKHQTEGLYGESAVEGAHLVKNKGEEGEEHYDLPIDGFFLAIGHRPNTEFLSGQITLDTQGYIQTENHTVRTNIEGVFAAGDVMDPYYRQGITSAGTGCQAAIEAERFLACQ